MTPDLLLGLDGGGTKTLLAVADRDAAVLHLSEHPTLDPFADPAWPETLAGAVATIRPLQPRLAGAVLGMSCHGEVSETSAHQIAVAQALLPGSTEVINDVEAAFDGALAGAPGVLLLAGTGSMAWAGNGIATMRCGGWGNVFGDEGSAYSIGREALGRASRALDGRSAERGFANRLLETLQVTPERLVAWCFGSETRRATVASVARAVNGLALAGDVTAQSILEVAGDALAEHAFACMRQLGLPAPLAWSYAGSVFHSSIVLGRVTKRIGAPARPPRLPPVGGALLRAARQAGWIATDEWIERLRQALWVSEGSVEAV